MSERNFRYLHLSDLHRFTDSTGPDQTQMTTELLNELSRDKGPIATPLDCIVITGDFFSKGTFSFDALKHFLEELYNVCSTRSKWNWQKGKPMDRIFFCPGNHDLNRNVSYHENCTDGGSEVFPSVYSRSAVLKEFVTNHPHQFPDPPENKSQQNKRQLLAGESFWQFSNAMEKLCEYPDKNSEFKHECNVFHISTVKTHNPVVFVGINTELYAGQIRTPEEIRSDLSKAYTNHLNAHNSFDFETASQAYQEYARLMNELEGEIANDKQLCFISKKAIEYADEQIKQIKEKSRSTPLVIKFGHRNLDSLTQQAQQYLARFAQSDENRCEVYLCGHSHKPGTNSVSVDILNGNAIRLYESTVGGIFADSSNYNSCSFMVGEIAWDKRAFDDSLEITPTLRQTLYLWVKRYDHKMIGNYQNTNKNKPYAWESIQLDNLPLRTYTTSVNNILVHSKTDAFDSTLAREEAGGKIALQDSKTETSDGRKPHSSTESTGSAGQNSPSQPPFVTPSPPTNPDNTTRPSPPHSFFPDF